MEFFVPSKMAGITFGSNIYLKGPYAEDYDKALLLAHEMGHIVQYNRLGDAKKFGREYMNNVGASTITTLASGSIPGNMPDLIAQIHDQLSLEQEADIYRARLDSMIKPVNLVNASNQNISVALHYHQCGRGVTEGWWNLAPGESKTEVIFTDSSTVDYHAHGDKGGQWGKLFPLDVADSVFTRASDTPLANSYQARFDQLAVQAE